MPLEVDFETRLAELVEEFDHLPTDDVISALELKLHALREQQDEEGAE